MKTTKDVLKPLNMKTDESVAFKYAELWERKFMSARISFGRECAAKQGKIILGTAPFGFIYEEGKLLIDPIESKVVKEILAFRYR